MNADAHTSRQTTTARRPSQVANSRCQRAAATIRPPARAGISPSHSPGNRRAHTLTRSPLTASQQALTFARAGPHPKVSSRDSPAPRRLGFPAPLNSRFPGQSERHCRERRSGVFPRLVETAARTLPDNRYHAASGSEGDGRSAEGADKGPVQCPPSSRVPGRRSRRISVASAEPGSSQASITPRARKIPDNRAHAVSGNSGESHECGGSGYRSVRPQASGGRSQAGLGTTVRGAKRGTVNQAIRSGASKDTTAAACNSGSAHPEEALSTYGSM